MQINSALTSYCQIVIHKIIQIQHTWYLKMLVNVWLLKIIFDYEIEKTLCTIPKYDCSFICVKTRLSCTKTYIYIHICINKMCKSYRICFWFTDNIVFLFLFLSVKVLNLRNQITKIILIILYFNKSLAYNSYLSLKNIYCTRLWWFS